MVVKVMWPFNKWTMPWSTCFYHLKLTCPVFRSLLHSNHPNTGKVWYSNGPNMSDFGMMFWKLDKKCMFYGLNGPPNHVIKPFENGTKKSPKSWMFRFLVSGIRIITVLNCGHNFNCALFSFHPEENLTGNFS